MRITEKEKARAFKGARAFERDKKKGVRKRRSVNLFSKMSGNRIYLGRIPYNARERDIERFFKGFGRIRDINLKNGFGFVVSDF